MSVFHPEKLDVLCVGINGSRYMIGLWRTVEVGALRVGKRVFAVYLLPLSF